MLSEELLDKLRDEIWNMIPPFSYVDKLDVKGDDIILRIEIDEMSSKLISDLEDVLKQYTLKIKEWNASVVVDEEYPSDSYIELYVYAYSDILSF